MIVHDAGEAWELVTQPDHGRLTGQLAAAWGNNEFATPRRRDSLVTAAARHDDGWVVWERWPRLSDDGRPQLFIEVPTPSHLAFYRAAITDVSLHDPYASLLISMHGAGIYRERYGTQPGLKNHTADQYAVAVEAFVAEVEGSYLERIAAIGVTETERWTDYKLLQIVDRLALYFSGLFDIAWGETHVIGPVPVDYEGADVEFRVDALSQFGPSAPRHVTIDPFPFVASPAPFTLERRTIAKGASSEEEFRERVRSAPVETVEIVVERPH